MDARHWSVDDPTEDPSAVVDRLQRDVRAGLRWLDGEAQNHIEVLTGKRLQQRTVPPRETTPKPPTLTALDPASAVLGSPSFTIHVRGTGFTPESVIIWNGGSEPTTFVSPTEVTTGVNMESAAWAVSIPVEVSGVAGVSNALMFTFTEAGTPAAAAAAAAPARKSPVKIPGQK